MGSTSDRATRRGEGLGVVRPANRVLWALVKLMERKPVWGWLPAGTCSATNSGAAKVVIAWTRATFYLKSASFSRS